MWKPAPRTDGNNVEFLEIYNSSPFFQDISSYQVTCADMNYTFPPNTLIPGGGFFVLAASPQGIAKCLWASLQCLWALQRQPQTFRDAGTAG